MRHNRIDGSSNPRSVLPGRVFINMHNVASPDPAARTGDVVNRVIDPKHFDPPVTQ